MIRAARGELGRIAFLLMLPWGGVTLVMGVLEVAHRFSRPHFDPYSGEFHQGLHVPMFVSLALFVVQVMTWNLVLAAVVLALVHMLRTARRKVVGAVAALVTVAGGVIASQAAYALLPDDDIADDPRTGFVHDGRLASLVVLVAPLLVVAATAYLLGVLPLTDEPASEPEPTWA